VPRVDVVVVTHNSRQHLRACVEPLCRDSAIEVIVVDNNSQDGTLATVADLPLKAIVREDNRGFGFACNMGWRAGNGRNVVFLNPDSQTDARSILSLANVLENDSRIGIVGPQIVDEQGRLQFSQRRFPSLMTSLAAAFFVPRVLPRTRWSLDLADGGSYAAPGSPDWVSGACLATRRDALGAVNGFDERFFMYYEDMDLCRRIRDIGYDVRYEPSIRLVHVGGASAPRERLIPVMARSRLLYARKHNGRGGELSERFAAGLYALTHMLLTTQGREARRGYLRALAVSARAKTSRTEMDGALSTNSAAIDR
jgi:N-acetylglucosaminyl-diphospho-decaprenol L-rhamnosyltransferase